MAKSALLGTHVASGVMGSLHYASSLAYMTLQFACAAAGGTFPCIAASSATHISPLDKKLCANQPPAIPQSWGNRYPNPLLVPHTLGDIY